MISSENDFQVHLLWSHRCCCFSQACRWRTQVCCQCTQTGHQCYQTCHQLSQACHQCSQVFHWMLPDILCPRRVVPSAPRYTSGHYTGPVNSEIWTPWDSGPTTPRGSQWQKYILLMMIWSFSILRTIKYYLENADILFHNVRHIKNPLNIVLEYQEHFTLYQVFLRVSW